MPRYGGLSSADFQDLSAPPLSFVDVPKGVAPVFREVFTSPGSTGPLVELTAPTTTTKALATDRRTDGWRYTRIKWRLTSRTKNKATVQREKFFHLQQLDRNVNSREKCKTQKKVCLPTPFSSFSFPKALPKLLFHFPFPQPNIFLSSTFLFNFVGKGRRVASLVNDALFIR